MLINTLKFIINHPLTSQFKTRALLHYLFYQIAKTFFNKRIVKWVNNSKFYLSKGDVSVTGHYYTGLEEFNEMCFFLNIMRPDNIFIDVGANVGLYTILSSKVIGAKTIAFEPVRKTYHALLENIKLNKINRLVEANNKCVGNANTNVFVSDFQDSAVNRVAKKNEKIKKNLTKLIRLDNYKSIYEKNILIKIDVEGFELEVIKGAKNLLKKNIIALIVEINNSGKKFGVTNKRIHKEILSYGFIPIAYDPINKEVKKIDSYSTKDKNTIYVKDVNLIRRLLVIKNFFIIHTPVTYKL
jgi:hypothetical protein